MQPDEFQKNWSKHRQISQKNVILIRAAHWSIFSYYSEPRKGYSFFAEHNPTAHNGKIKIFMFISS